MIDARPIVSDGEWPYEKTAMLNPSADVARSTNLELAGGKISVGGEDSAAMLASVMGLVLAFMAVASRAGFQDMLLEPVVRSLGLCWLLLHFGWFVRGIAQRVAGRSGRHSGESAALPQPSDAPSQSPEGVETTVDEPWWLSTAALTVTCLAAVFALGQLAGHFGWTFFHWLAYVGFALGGIRALAAVRRLPGQVWRTAGLVGVAVFLGVYCAAAIWGSGYQNPLFVERLAQGTANIDTLFHAVVSNMIRTHGIPSTGLDGTPFLPYHFGSHWLFAQICNLLDVPVIDFYNVGYPVVFAPFGLFCLLTFAHEIGRPARSTMHTTAHAVVANSVEARGPSRTHSRPLFWFVLCLGYIGFLPLDAGFETPAARTSILISESYAVAISIAFLGLSIILRLFRETQATQQGGGGSRYLAAGVVLPLLLAAVCLCKISIFLLLAVAGLYGFARLRLYRSPVFIVMLLASLICGGVAFRLSYAPGYEAETGWRLFGYLRANVEPQWWGMFWLCYFIWPWVLVAMRCRERCLGTLAEFAAALRRRELLDVELIFIVAAAGVAPGALISHWSSMHYFSEYQHWLALGLVLGLLSRRNVPLGDDAGSHAAADLSASMRQLAVRGVCVVLAATMILNTMSLLRQALTINLASRGYPEGGTGVGVKLMAGRFGDAWETLSQQTRQVESGEKLPRFALINQLRLLDRLDMTAKRSSVLFVPRSNRVYWELISTPYTPRDLPLVGPALTGMAMVDGLYDPPDGDRWVGYGYQEYSRPMSGESASHFEISDPALCTRVREMGFSQVVEVMATRDKERTEIRSHTVGCR